MSHSVEIEREAATYEPLNRHLKRADQPLRVLHIINGEHFAGAERVQDLLAVRLPELNIEATFAALKDGVFKTKRASAADLQCVPMRGLWDLRPAWTISRWASQLGVSAVHSHTVRSALIGQCVSALNRIPLIHHLHSPTLHDTEHPFRNRLNSLVEQSVFQRADKIICVSDSLRQYAERQGAPKNKLCVVHNGVPDVGPLTARERPGKPWVLGVVALFRPRKGLEVLIQALAELRSEGKQVKLVAIGGFETAAYQDSIVKLAQHWNVSDCIEWTGFVSDAPQRLQQLDALVLPSLFGEGLPMVVLEAMAAGAPVVASRVEGVVEAIRHGVDGLIVEPGSPSALSAALRDLIEGRHDWAAMRRSAHNRHSLLFSDQSMAAGVSDVYRQVIAARGGPFPSATTAARK